MFCENSAGFAWVDLGKGARLKWFTGSRCAATCPGLGSRIWEVSRLPLALRLLACVLTSRRNSCRGIRRPPIRGNGWALVRHHHPEAGIPGVYLGGWRKMRIVTKIPFEAALLQ